MSTKKLAFIFAMIFSFPAMAQVKRLEVYAHRGMRTFLPENSMPAYKEALDVGVDWVDMDVVLTKDGHVVVSHDPVLNPNIVRDRHGNYVDTKIAVKDLTLKELQKYDIGRLKPDTPYARFFPDQTPIDGTHMPTLREVIRYVKKRSRGRVGFQIEIKTDPIHPEVSADPTLFARALSQILIEENVIGQSEIQAFDFRCLSELQKISTKFKTAYLTSRDNEPGAIEDFASNDARIATLWTGGPLVRDYGSIPKMIKALGGFAWEPEDAQLTQESLTEAHELGLKVVVWSWPEMLGRAYDPDLVGKMINWGVDGIITDDPARLVRDLKKRGLPFPSANYLCPDSSRQISK